MTDFSDNTRSRFREVLGMYVPEGPLPPRPERGSGKGGPSINQTPAPPVVTSVWSASDAAANAMTLSNGGLTVTSAIPQVGSVRGTISKSSGKLYFEVKANAPSNAVLCGLANGTINVSSYLGGSAYSLGIDGADNYLNGFTNNYTPAYTPVDGDVFQFAVDLTAGNVWMNVNNAHSWFTGNPATGTAPMATFVPTTVGPLFPAVATWSGGSGVWTLQPTAASQKYAPPAGFSPWR